MILLSNGTLINVDAVIYGEWRKDDSGQKIYLLHLRNSPEQTTLVFREEDATAVVTEVIKYVRVRDGITK